MDAKIAKIEEKLDRIVEIQSEMRANLQEHMRRTYIAEENIDSISSSIAPIQEHVAFIRGIGKFLTIITTIAGSIGAFWQIFISK